MCACKQFQVYPSRRCRDAAEAVGGGESQGHQSVAVASSSFNAATASYAAITAGVLTAMLLVLLYAIYRHRRRHAAAKRACASRTKSQPRNAMLHARSRNSTPEDSSQGDRVSACDIHRTHSIHTSHNLQDGAHQVRVPFLPVRAGIQTSLSGVRICFVLCC